MSDLTAGQMVMPYLYRGSPGLLRLNQQIMADRAAAGRPDAAIADGRRNGQRPGHGTAARAQWDRRRGNKPCASCLSAERLARKLREESRS